MKHLTKIFAIILVAFLLLGEKSLAQDSEQPLLITSFNMVSMSDIGKVNKMVDSIFTPILKELVDEEMIYSFGQFNHSWGDEWNVIYWYVAEDIPAFVSAFSELFSRAEERHPSSFDQFAGWCFEHKDSMYSVGPQTGPPTPPGQ